ncbi:MAG TPA: hypothetical protein VL171_05070 [Verrucomicrobiae bacterium]|nr:hypothetical protein [Verrucomicrobiae bacterium]
MTAAQSEDTTQRWALWIDLEGFSEFHAEDRAPSLLSDLAFDLYEIGCGYCDNADRDGIAVFVHQFGDGFILYPFNYEHSLERPVAVAVAAMLATASRGGWLRTAISYGGLSDVVGWHHKEIQECVRREKNLAFTLGAGPGKMIITPVMGEGLIRAYGLSHRRDQPRGPQLLVDRKLETRLEGINGKLLELQRDDQCIVIDWLRSELPLAKKLLGAIHSTVPPADTLVQKLRRYLTDNPLRQDWKDGADMLIRHRS